MRLELCRRRVRVDLTQIESPHSRLLCQCWDAKAFRRAIPSRELLRPGAAQIRVRLELGGGAHRNARLVMLRQASRWKIDDMFSSDYPRGLKQALRDTIAADERLKK